MEKRLSVKSKEKSYTLKNGEFGYIWQTEPRLPHSLWVILNRRKAAFGFAIQVSCKSCGSVLDSKHYWSFNMPRTKVELTKLGYHVVSEWDCKQVIFEKANP